MATYLRNGTSLRTSQYKKLTGLLSHLESLLPYAQIADSLPTTILPTLSIDPVAQVLGEPVPNDLPTGLQTQLETILNHFLAKKAISASGETLERVEGRNRRLGKKDEMGRVMAVGRRKESAARVWLVPVPSSSTTTSTQLGIPGRVLINSVPLPNYFPQPTQRATAINPLTLTSTLGSFNVFAIAKGGGLSAQADAVAMGLARALVEWETCEIEQGKMEESSPQIFRELLKKAGLIERDPRMVERKKTGQPKARKMPTWSRGSPPSFLSS